MPPDKDEVRLRHMLDHAREAAARVSCVGGFEAVAKARFRSGTC